MPLTREPKINDAKDVLLGREYTDEVTGLKGVAIIIYIHLTGCDQVCLEYVAQKQHRYLTVDASRLVELRDRKSAKKAAKTGASDAPHPTRGPALH